jgi:hypothetical protein
VLVRPSPVPKAPGVYAWYFRGLHCVPSSACCAKSGFQLLYIGISPSAPASNGKGPSRLTLHSRIRYHMQRNAEGFNVAAIVGVPSGFGAGFSSGEARLSQWMEENARVVWHVSPEPWDVERQLIGCSDLPLNLDQNRNHAFHTQLMEFAKSGEVASTSASGAVGIPPSQGLFNKSRHRTSRGNISTPRAHVNRVWLL